jgi:hypothetical protein
VWPVEKSKNLEQKPTDIVQRWYALAAKTDITTLADL